MKKVIPQIANLYTTNDKTVGLKNLKADVSIVNSSAMINYLQVFQNDSRHPIECVYKFPSDYYFAVVGVSVKIGDKLIETEIMEKKKAEEKYEDAVTAGHTAVKLNLDEKLPDIIELNIGQLQSNEIAEVRVKMVCELEVIMHGHYSFIFPLSFVPKYGDPKGVKGESGIYIPVKFEANI